ncbi:MAG: hypothetical protein EHM14_09430 [Methanothrix sp.]|nr:MAG: hypothetical protein EHM14_09430 [Methanothrix sp.]
MGVNLYGQLAISLFLLLLIMHLNSISADGILIAGDTHGIVFDSKDSINGNGSFSNYNYLDNLGIHVDNRWDEQIAQMKLIKKEHGCGYLQRQSLLNSMKSVQHLMVDQTYNLTNSYTRNMVTEAKKIISSPVVIRPGVGYYSAHPIKQNDLFSDLLWIKDYASETSMDQEIFQAHAVQGKLSAAVEDIYLVNDKNGPQDLSRIAFKSEIAIQNGTGHLGFLQGNDEDSRWCALVDPDIDIEQSFSGNFLVDSNLTFNWPAKREYNEDYWLDCCSGGWNNLSIADKRNFGQNTAKIFDCTCFEPLAINQTAGSNLKKG